jgi:proteasome lid subunit RPN8/RPN11
MLTPDIKENIAIWARANPGQETCGFVLTGGAVIAVENVAQHPEKEFEIKAEVYARYGEDITAIWHSHPEGEFVFSPADVQGCKASGLPWVLFHCPTQGFKVADPTGTAPYLGRDWVYGLNDCFGLVTDWLRKEMGFDFPDVDRYHDKPEPSLKILEAFPPLMESCGLKRVTDGVQFGDVLFMQINSPVPNHCAVMVDPSKNRILHHLIDRYSSTDYYGSYWRNVTDSVWRICN